VPTGWCDRRRLGQRGRRVPTRVAGTFLVVNAAKTRLVELTTQQLESATGSGRYLLL
jgi:hypothetical protein